MADGALSVPGRVVASTHDDGVVLMNLSTGRLFAVNTTGAYIWRGIEQGQSARTIAVALANDFQLPADAAHAHTSRFIETLAVNRLVCVEGRA